MGEKKAMPRHSNRLQRQYRAEFASTCFMSLLVCLFMRTSSQSKKRWAREIYGVGVKNTHGETLNGLQRDSGVAGTLRAKIWERQSLLAWRKSWSQQDVWAPAFLEVGWSQSSGKHHLSSWQGTIRVSHWVSTNVFLIWERKIQFGTPPVTVAIF